MSDKPVSRIEMHLQEAQKAIEKKEFLEFVENISKAEIFAETNNDYLPSVTFIWSIGLFKFNRYRKALDIIPEALKYNHEEDKVFKLKNYEGIIYCNLGEFNKAKNIFTKFIEDGLQNAEDLVEEYLNLAWVSLISNRSKKELKTLDEAKKFLDLANLYFDNLPNSYKLKTCNNYGVYYFYIKEYDEAIHSFEEAMKYCEEKDYPWIYTNLADIYLQFEGIDVSDKIKEYTEKAEVIANKYKNDFLIGKAFYIQAMSQLKADEPFRCLDTLYVSFEYFKKAENYPHAFDCLIKMNEIISDYKLDRLKSLKDSLNKEFKDTSFCNIL